MEETITRREGGVGAAASANRKEVCQWRSKAEEYRMISNLTGFDHLRAMMEGEATVNRRKRKRRRRNRNRNRERKKNNNEFQFHAQHPLPVDDGKPAIDPEHAGRDGSVRAVLEVSERDLTEISDNDIDTAVEEKKMIETVQAVKNRTEGNDNETGPKEVINLCSSSSEDDDLISNISSGKSTSDMMSEEAKINVDGDTVMRKELKTVVAEETVDARKKETEAEKPKCIEDVESPEKSAVNIVLQKLLRKPRYFDPPNGSWSSCLSCGDDHPEAANCTLRKRLKACFLCGSLQHVGKYCTQRGQYCFICRGGHFDNDCPEQQEENKNYNSICLRCGDSGHDMFSCRSDYSPDDLEKILCYICNSFGHLSCVKLPDTSPTEVSCYNCGQSGHLGSACSKCPRAARSSKSHALCYRCREEGHFARTCTLSRKASRVRAKMRSLRSSSAPPNCGPQDDVNGEIQERVIINA